MGCSHDIVDGVEVCCVRPTLTGVPTELLGEVKGPINFETFVGDETNNRSAEDYTRAVTSGATFTSVPVAPAAGDVVSRGIWRCTLDADPTATKGIVRRQEEATLGPDCFGADNPTLWAARFRLNTVAAPTATSYEASSGGLGHFTSSTTAVSEGVIAIFDPTVGVVGWVVRALRAGAPTDSTMLFAHDNDFHTIGFLHRGAEVIPFADDVAAAAIVGANIQPATAIESLAHRLRTFALGGQTADIDLDWVAWGS